MFPDQCRVCEQALREFSRVPVCGACLRGIEPLAAEYCCSRCHTPFLNSHPLDEQGVCALCRLGLNGFDDAYSFALYEGVLRQLIHLFKYNGIEPLAGPLGEHLARALPRSRRFDGIVPVPLHWWRRWRRGFNQSELLARELSRRTGVPVMKILGRRRAAPAQAGLSRAQRRDNVAGAFRARRGRDLRGLRLILLDDVLTTGATARACAAALKEAGAVSVTVLTLARADRRLGLDLSAVPARPRSFAMGAT